MRLIQKGRPSAPIWFIGEAPGKDEDERGEPFVGASGIELDKLLREAGFDPSAPRFFTNICHVRPPSYQKNGRWVHNDIGQFFLTKTAASRAGVSPCCGRYPSPPIMEGLSHLRTLLQTHRPVIVVALGGTALWATTGHNGITKWRGSVFDTADAADTGALGPVGKVICTLHPADVLRQWTHRPLVLNDLRRARREADFREVRKPNWNFTIATSVSTVRDWLRSVGEAAPLVCDTEGWGRVDCIGFASSSSDALCIPFRHETSLADDFSNLHYWSEDDEVLVTTAVREALCSHPITFHNAIWDCQVIARRWGFLPHLSDDTQAMQHVAFPGLIGGRIDPVSGEVSKEGSSLSLSFIASMYCEYYRYWKDDGRHFDPAVGDERTYWHYNCEDCVRTFECWEVLRTVLAHGGLEEQYAHVIRSYGPVLAMMFRGIRYNRALAAEQRSQIINSRDSAKAWLDYVTDTSFNPKSAPQCQALIYGDLQVPVVLNKDTKAPTLRDDTLEAIKRRNPLLSPLITQIQNYRTLDTVKADCDPELAGEDGVLRFALNPAFVETFRFSSNSTAWGEGGNVQNIKRNDE